MIVAVADTHAALWYLFNNSRLSLTAAVFLDEASNNGHSVAVSAVRLAEVVYLVEKRRLPPLAYSLLSHAMNDTESFLVELPLTTAVIEAMRTVSREEVPDRPDRMIAATAVSLGVPLVSRDRRILATKVSTLW